MKVPYSCCKTATEDNYKTGTETTCTTGMDSTVYNNKVMPILLHIPDNIGPSNYYHVINNEKIIY